MGQIYGGHLVAKVLKEVEGVSTVFSLSGGHIDRIYDGFFEYGIRIVDVRHEQAAAIMAHAWSVFGDCVTMSPAGVIRTAEFFTVTDGKIKSLSVNNVLCVIIV